MSAKYSDDFLSYESPDGKMLQVVSSIPILLSRIVSKAIETHIEADVIVVDGAIDAGGQKLTLRCRELRFLEGACISSTGASGVDWAPDLRPVGPQDAGSNGADGQDGRPAMAGGVIDICCSYSSGDVVVNANGGRGGRGQDGGNGVKGATGGRGHTAEFDEGSAEPVISIYSGGGGRTGGAVGLPGRNGPGGSKGEIRFNCGIRINKFDAQVSDGDSGESAQSGDPGEGGDGGLPGELYKREWANNLSAISELPLNVKESFKNVKMPMESSAQNSADKLIAWWDYDGQQFDSFKQASNLHHDYSNIVSPVKWRPPHDDPGPPPRSWRTRTKVRDGQPGVQGAAGDLRVDEVRARQKFLKAQPTRVDNTVVTPEVMGRLYSEAMLEIQAFALEDEFRQSGIDVVKDFWERVGFYLSITQGAVSPTISTIHSRLCAISRKAQLGLDFFGYSLEQVPLLSMETYRELLDRTILPQTRFIEERFDRHVEKCERGEELESGMVEILRQVRGQQISLKGRKTLLEADIVALNGAIPAMNASVQDAYQQLLLGKDKLDAAIKRKNQGGCNFVETLVTAAILVSAVAATGGSALAAAGAVGKFVDVWNKNNASAGSLWEAKSLLSDSVKPVGGFADAADEIKKIQEAYKKLDGNTKASRLPALSLDRDKFDQIASEYADLIEAKDYRQLGYAYLDRIETRNQAILDYDALFVRYIDLVDQIATAKSAEETAEFGVSKSIDLAAPLVYARLKRLRRITLDGAAQLIHAQQKSMGYIFGKHLTPTISSRSSAEIAAAHADVNIQWTRAKETFKPIRELISQAVQVPLRQFAAPQDWTRFVSLESTTRPLPLNICVRDLPKGSILAKLPGLRVTGASLRLHGVVLQEQVQLSWALYHEGRETILLQDGGAVSFSKLPTKISGIISESAIVKTDNTEQRLYNGWSIFSTWRLVLYNPSAKVDLKNLEDLVLAIDGYYMG